MTRKEKILTGLSLLLASSLFWSNFLISISVFLLLVTSLLFWYKREDHTNRKTTIRTFIRTPAFSILTLIFFVTVISGLFSEDMNKGFRVVQLRLPYLLLPLAYFLYQPISKKVWDFFVPGFILLSVVFSSGVIYHFALNYSELISGLSSGKSISTPVSHIRFSLLLVTAFCLGLIYLVEHFKSIRPRSKWLIAAGLLYLLVTIHILSVKTGWVALYLGILAIFIFYSFKWHKVSLFIGGLLMVLAMPFLAYQLIPSFKMKVGYTLHDWRQIYSSDGGTYSDVERLTSISYGWQVFLEHPITGTGVGDLKQAMENKYIEKRGTKEGMLMPHNQFVYFLASLGLLGGTVAIAALLFPYFVFWKYKDPYLLVLAVTYLASCFVESSMETSVGMHVHLLFLLLRLAITQPQKPIS